MDGELPLNLVGGNITPPEEMHQAAPVAQVEAPQVVNVKSDTGEIGSLPISQLAEAQQNGFEVASDDEVKQYLDQQKYSSLPQQLLGTLEEAGRAATFGLSTPLQIQFGADKEAIKAREENLNPVAKFAGAAAGLIGSGGFGEGAILEKLGKSATEAVGLAQPIGMAAKVGSAAVKGAAETAAFQVGDEYHKAVMSDAPFSVEAAVANIGLAGVLGGAFGGGLGTISPLWDAVAGSKTAKILKAIQDKTNGSAVELPTEMSAAIQKMAPDLAEQFPEIKAAFSGDPVLQNQWLRLFESNTGSALEAQANKAAFVDNLQKNLSGKLGKETLETVHDFSPNKTGTELVTEMEKTIQGMKKNAGNWQKIEETYKNIDLPQDRPILKTQKNPYLSADEAVQSFTKEPGTITKLKQNLMAMAEREGYLADPNLEASKKLMAMIKSMDNIQTLEQLRKFESNRLAEFHQNQLWDLKRNVRPYFEEARMDALESAFKSSGKAEAELAYFTDAKQKYSQFMKYLDGLDDRLHLGNYRGADSFLYNLKGMAPEKVLNRLLPKNDAGLQELLPDAWKGILNNYRIDSVVRQSVKEGPSGTYLDINKLAKIVRGMNTDLREATFTREQLASIEAAEKLVKALPEKIGKSGTPQGVEGWLSDKLAVGTGMVTAIASHNPIVGAAVGLLSKQLQAAPDAVRLGLLKFLGSEKPVDAGAFKAMINLIETGTRGAEVTDKAISKLIKSGSVVLPSQLIPNESSRSKLDKQVKEYQLNPMKTLEQPNKIPGYMPQHGVSVEMARTNALNQLAQMRPPDVEPRNALLDSKPVQTAGQKAEYERKIDIAQSPLIVLKHISDKTLQPQDVTTLASFYPSLYKAMKGAMFNKISDAHQNGETIPYDVRMNMAIFMGQPLDSTMTPEAITKIQSMSPGVSKDQQDQARVQSQSGPKNLGKLAKQAMPGMARREAGGHY